jgi:hypothetical protein
MHSLWQQTACRPQCSPKAQQGERRGRRWGWRVEVGDLGAGRSTWGPAWCCLFRARSPPGPGCGTAAGSEHRLSANRLPSALVSAQWLLVVRLGPPLGDHPSSGCAAHTACNVERGTSCCMLHGAMVRVVMLAYIARMSYVVRCVPHAVPPHAAGREYTIQHTAHAPDCGPQPHGRQPPAACSMLYRLPPIESNP